MYLGSVRFFRHLIIALFLLVFILPLIGAGVLGVKYAGVHSQLQNAQETIGNYSAAADELSAKVQDLDNSIRSQDALLQLQVDDSISDQVLILQQQLDVATRSLKKTQQDVQDLQGLLTDHVQKKDGSSSLEEEK